MRGFGTVVGLALMVAALVGAGAQEKPSDAPEETTAGSSLDLIREDLAALRFEKALNAIEAYLADPARSEAERVEALILRAQAHVAYGDLDAAEKDYGELLLLRPAYLPEESLTPPKAFARFRQTQKATVGTLQLSLTPPDASLLVDGREVTIPPDGALRVVAGERILRGERIGFDPLEVALQVPAGETVPAEIRLVPNSRTVVIRTGNTGVEVLLDGVRVGETVGPANAPPGSRSPAELVIENVALGEHTFVLRKSCYRDLVLTDMITVDLTDYSPKIYRPVTLDPVHAWLSLKSGPGGARVLVDGDEIGILPLEAPLELCPGSREVEVLVADRTVWRSREELEPDERRTIEIRPRPGVVLIGDTAWPGGLETFASRFSTLATLPLPTERDLTRPEGWTGVELPPGVDLAVAALPAAAEASPRRWMAYSPLLGALHRIDGVEVDPDRPEWTVTSFGLHLVDSRVGGTALVAEVRDGGAAAVAGVRPGERLTAVDGDAVRGAREAREILLSKRPGAPVAFRLESPGAEPRVVEVIGRVSPRLQPLSRRIGPARLITAAWASLDAAAAEGEERSAALANLAILLSESGRHVAALETWRRVDWTGRTGLGPGTVAYHSGRSLKALGREDEAVGELRSASRSGSTAVDDDGPLVAPAALDHLADLGVSAEGATGR